jgi:hypothetical protein
MVVSTLIELFKDEDSDVRYFAAEAIGKQSTLSETTINALVDLFKDEDSFIRYYAAEVIGNQSTLSETTISALVDLFQDEDSFVRYNAVEAIGKQSTLSEMTISALVDLFKHEDSDVRCSAAETVSGEPNLINKVLDALGLFNQSISHCDRQPSSAHLLQHIGPLCMSLLWRAFDEQFSLYSANNLLIINQSSGLRTAALENEDLVQVWIIDGRRGVKDITNGYNLWGPFGGLDGDQLVKNDLVLRRL